jgi:G protein beta subunit-like protein
MVTRQQQQQMHGRHGSHHGHSQPAATTTPNPIDVLLATAGYDHTIRFWEALSGACYRTIQHPDSVSLTPSSVSRSSTAFS